MPSDTIQARLAQQNGDAGDGGGHLAALRRRLAREADRAGMLDVGHVTTPSPIGALLVAATPAGIVRIAFEGEDHRAVVDHLAAALGPRVLEAPDLPVLTRAVAQLDEYFAGVRHRFDLPLDLRLSHGFRRTVLDHLREVPYGTTATYSELAAAAGRPRAVRAAASACATNPVPVVVPCHRVVRSDGTVGAYLGGTPAKELLLHLEAA